MQESCVGEYGRAARRLRIDETLCGRQTETMNGKN